MIINRRKAITTTAAAVATIAIAEPVKATGRVAALVKEYRRLEREWFEAMDRADQASDDWSRAGEPFLFQCFDGHMDVTIFDRDIIGKKAAERRQEAEASRQWSPSLADRLAREIDAEEERSHDRYAEAWTRYGDARRAHGVAGAEDDSEAAADRFNEAVLAVFACPCEGPDDWAAKADFIVKRRAEYGDLSAEEVAALVSSFPVTA